MGLAAVIYVPVSSLTILCESILALGCGVWSVVVLGKIINPVDGAGQKRQVSRYGYRLVTMALFGDEA